MDTLLFPSLSPNTLFSDIRSASGMRWAMRSVDERLVMALSQRLSLPEIVARVVAGRGVTLEQAEHFMNPTLKALLPDPFHLLDMDIAAERVTQAIMKGENIAIFGDYDVDGATSSALLKRFFRMVGVEVRTYIPDRITEGYGPNTKALLELKSQGVDLVITVDCGTVSFEPLEAAHNAGLDVVVIDHHLGTEILPKAVAVVNPNRLDESSTHRNLAAVGVSFLLAVAINTMLRAKGWYGNARPEPNLLSLLDLVALGSVCDVMSLTGANRAFVTQGLKIMARRGNLGLKVLSDVAALDSAPQAYHLGFVLGPRINAGGRVGKADLGTRLLSTEDPDEAFMIAQELNRLNAERKAIEQLVQEEAIQQVESQPVMYRESLVMVAGEGWHPGVIGIVASRLKERYNRPAVVIALENGIGKASARSVTGVDFGAAVVVAKNTGILLAGGGHSMAAGFSIEQVKIPELHDFFSSRFAEGVKAYDEGRALQLDGMLATTAVTPELATMLEQAGPFGVGNPTPRFALANCYIASADKVGTDHVRCIVSDPVSRKSLKAMAFRCMESPLGEMLLSSKGKQVYVAGQIRLNHWQGNTTAEFTIEDVAFERNW